MYQTLRTTGLDYLGLEKCIIKYNLLYPPYQINQTFLRARTLSYSPVQFQCLYRSVIGIEKLESLVNFKYVFKFKWSSNNIAGPQITLFQRHFIIMLISCHRNLTCLYQLASGKLVSLSVILLKVQNLLMTLSEDLLYCFPLIKCLHIVPQILNPDI